MTVSIWVVIDKRTGSEMSAFATDFFLSIPCLGCTLLGLNMAALGVVGLETGGVWFDEKAGIGDGRELL